MLHSVLLYSSILFAKKFFNTARLYSYDSGILDIARSDIHPHFVRVCTVNIGDVRPLLLPGDLGDVADGDEGHEDEESDEAYGVYD